MSIDSCHKWMLDLRDEPGDELTIKEILERLIDRLYELEEKVRNLESI
jgi:hypothetical protein